jgi:DNA helicase IV
VPGHKIRCGTVQAFKGLDAPAVIVTDVDDVASVYGRQLLYIACSRATERLVVHVDSSVGPELVKLVVLRGYHSA